jgi:glycosyltransferase involved in cell wall biosynthesis
MTINSDIRVALLTGGYDEHYAFGVLSGLFGKDIKIDFIGNDVMEKAEIVRNPQVRFFNLRGHHGPAASLPAKIRRIFRYYFKVFNYASASEAKIFHILWLNTRFEYFERTLLNGYYRLLGKKLVYTAHNVNARERDGTDSWTNRCLLKVMYRFYDHTFVHTEKMKQQLVREYGVSESRITVIPFGVNDVIPRTGMSRREARQRLGVADTDHTMLFFGRIAPYKGLDLLVQALPKLAQSDPNIRLIIAGEIKKRDCDAHWDDVRRMIDEQGMKTHVIQKIEYISDEDVEIYFKAADVLVMPYRHIYQSGLPFLAYNFGLPIVATDVGSLREDIVEGETGFVCKAGDPEDLSKAVSTYFGSGLFMNLEKEKEKIIRRLHERHSWSAIGETIYNVYKTVAEM